MKRKLWEKSTNGPDWTDIEAMMRAMSALHSGTVGLTLFPRGTGSTGGLSVGASIMFDVLPGSALPAAVSTVKDWPCSAHSTFDGHCFALLHELDFLIAQTYEQSSLWE
jgi:hypothetical protein